MVPADIEALTAAAFVAAALLGAVGVLFAVVVAGHSAAMIAAALASAALAVGGLGVIAGPAVAFSFGSVLGFGLIDERFDALSGVFLLALGVVGLAASVYAVGYHDAGRSRLDTVAYIVFLASLALVFGSASAFSFLFAWEMMALSSAILVIGPRPDRSVLGAGYLYLVMTHLATAAIAIAFAIWSTSAGSLDFATWHEDARSLGGQTRDLVFILVLIGFGTKAGMIPLHVWLPRAHPVAPSHVSALMSGVMIKAGIYGIIRFGMDILGPGPAWWGIVAIAIGAASAVLGILYALAERDLKRLLAFSSVENIGIILLGVGVALLGMSQNATSLVVVGLAAALFHTLNHAIFKALLFLGAGAVQWAAGSRDLNRLGGLARVMPLTALTFGLGATAISGLPPLNGFASEWLVFQGLLSAGTTGELDPVARFSGFLAAGALALTAALSVACFVKATGMTFLALPRSDGAASAGQIGPSMRAAMAGLAAGCVAIGVAAGPIAAALAGAARVVHDPGPATREIAPDAVPTIGNYEPALLAAGLILTVVAIAAAGRLRARPVRRVPTWTCGILPEPAFEYTATSFSKPLRLFFEPVLRPDRELRVELHEGTPFPKRVDYRSEVAHVIESRVYAPLHRAGIALSQGVRRLQQGTLQLYLAYTVGALVILLLLARR